MFRFLSPDYFRLAPWEGDGLHPVGYGFDSVEASVRAARHINAETAELDETAALARRQKLLADNRQSGNDVFPRRVDCRRLRKHWKSGFKRCSQFLRTHLSQKPQEPRCYAC